MEAPTTQLTDRYAELEAQVAEMAIEGGSEMELLADMYSSLRQQAEAIQRMIESDTQELIRQLEYNVVQLKTQGFDANLDSADRANMIEKKRRGFETVVKNLDRLYYRLRELVNKK